MTIMRNTISSLMMFLAFCLSVAAQDARQRTVETIVQDVLAALPVDNMPDCYVHMADLAGAAPASVEILGSMLKPEGADNLVEYAISGVVRYATDPANEKVRDAVRKGLEKAVSSCEDRYDRQFLESQLRLMSSYEDEFDEDIRRAYPLDKADALFGSGNTHDRCSALWLYVEHLGEKSQKMILKALRSDDRDVRTTALRAYAPVADEAFYGKVSKLYGRLSAEAKADVLAWIAEEEIVTLSSLALSQMSEEGEVGAAAIEAVAALGGDKAADALFSVPVTEDNFDDILEALCFVDADIVSKVTSSFARAEGLSEDLLVVLSGRKRIQEAAPYVVALAAEGDALALSALEGVVGISDFNALAGMMERRPSDDIREAMCAAVKSLDSSEAFDMVKSAAEASASPELFYSVMAQTAGADAVEYLTRMYESGSAQAIAALTEINDISVAPVLIKASDKDEKFLKNYLDVISANESDDELKCEACVQALSKSSDDGIIAYALSVLGQVPSMRAFTVAQAYLDRPATAYAAASALRSIAARSAASIDYYVLRDGLEKAAEVFRRGSRADDGYAVDEITKILDSVKPYEIFRLSDDEKKQGYEILFDGTDLSAWTGDKVGYTAVNGCINVTASYGDTKNLYTIKEYSDFVLRFEFCFEKPGVNNGVGIRTPMGVDAAYYGMCEVQVLDHDAPIYAGLKPYQVHGSVYGIVPAKRIVHKPLGEWSTMEIKVVGDKITVTVNGEVINEADVRKASRNGTIDSREHPGIFNKKGHIGFLGHGAGLKYRNVRVLDLSK